MSTNSQAPVNPQEFTKHPEVRELLQDLKSACKGKAFSDVVDGHDRQYVDIVMEGGGVLGIALVGYTFMLEEMGIRFRRIGGTSAGSINALLLAGLGTMDKPKSKLVVERLANLNLSDFLDGDHDAKDFIRSYLRGGISGRSASKPSRS